MSKLGKKTTKEILLALAAEEAASEQEHRVRFNRRIEYIQGRLSAMSDASEFTPSGVSMDFLEVVRIAKHVLRMQPEEFEEAVAVLNTPFSRVVNRSPLGKDTRDVPDWMRATAEELRLSYSLMTPYDAAGWIADHGSKVGYTAAQIAAARAEFKPLERERLARRDAEDAARARARSLEIESSRREFYLRHIKREVA